jgi:hypothetical protein
MMLVCLNEAGIIGAPESLGIWIILRPPLGKVESTNFMTQKMNLYYHTQNYVVLFFSEIITRIKIPRPNDLDI